MATTPTLTLQPETFTASRWTKGNSLFPTRLVVSSQRVSRVKSRWFGSNEESIALSKVASVHISTGMVFAFASSPPAGPIPSPATATAKPTPSAFANLIESHQATFRD